MTDRVITFLSDYGLADDFVGVCHGVIASLYPRARVIDLTHGVPRHDVRAGALILRGSLAFMPLGVHLAIVDPGVGSARRALALALSDGRVLVGPDNGLLWPASEVAGGIAQAVDISRSRYRLEPVSATFHGRDLFAPVAAHLAAGAELADVGEPCEPGDLVRLELPRAQLEDGALVAHALYVDRFGNVQLDAGPGDLRAAGLEDPSAGGLGAGRTVALELELELESGRVLRAPFARTFAEGGRDQPLVYVDAQGQLAVALRNGDAAARLGIAVDDTLRITAT